MKSKKSLFRTFIYVALIFCICLMAYTILTAGNSGEQIAYSQFETKLTQGEIKNLYIIDGIGKIRLVDSEIKEKDFPKYADYYFSYSTGEVDKISELVTNYNNGKLEGDADFLVFISDNPQPSLISRILPYLTIVIVVVVAFVLYKLLAQNTKGAMSFGKSKAKISSNVKIRFSDVAGADEEKEELQEIVEFLKNPQKFVELGARIPKGVLLVGPPGTGKTLLAKAVAGESNVPFFSISGSDFVEMFVGVGASRVRDLFDNAKRSMPCIIFIDEIDAVGRQRGAGLGGGNDEREQTLNQLLVEMDGFNPNDGIIVLAATNRSDVLDPALLRPGRFDRQIYVHIPDVAGREGIIRIHAKGKPVDETIDYKTIARITSGFTGADLENMLNEAAILAARAGRKKIIMKDLTEGINKVIMGPQKKSLVFTEKDKKFTSYHEAGHAIVSKKMPNCDEVQEVSIIPRGMANGYTMSRPDKDDRHVTFGMLNDQIASLMGGRIAEELILNDVSTGASCDISRATDIARKMVTEWGMSKKLGFMNTGEPQEIFVGRDYQAQKQYSEKTAGEIDDEMREILNSNYERTKKVLKENVSILHEMSKLLLEKETIYKEEVDMLMEGKTAKEVADIMNEKQRIEKENDEKNRKEFEDRKKQQSIESKIRTAESLLKAGVITQEDFNKVKEEAEKAKSEISENSAEEKKVTEEKNYEKKYKAPKKIEIRTEKSVNKKNETEEVSEKKSDKKDGE